MSSARARGAGTLASSFAMTPVARATIDGGLGPESKRPERGGERTQRCSQSNEPPGATGPNEPELSVAPNEPGRCRQSNPRRNGPNEPERSAAPNEPECGRKPNEPRHTGTKRTRTWRRSKDRDCAANANGPERPASAKRPPRESWICSWSVSGCARIWPARRSGCGQLPGPAGGVAGPEPARPEPATGPGASGRPRPPSFSMTAFLD
jgi:hypothetical protein